MDRAKLLEKIAKSNASSGGNNLRDGRGRLAIKTLRLEDGYNGARFAIEAIVVASGKIPVVELKTGKALDIEPNAPGTDVGIVQMLDKHESAFGAVKGFVLELFNIKEAETTDAEIVEAVDELTAKNSAHGMVIDYTTYRKVTREKKQEIVLPKWSHVEQSEADIAAMKKWMESLVLAQQAANAQGVPAGAKL